jgi:hypothetical protein
MAMPAWRERQGATEHASSRKPALPWQAGPRRCGGLAVLADHEKVGLRMPREGPKGFEGGLSAGNYVSFAGASPATATRDHADLVAKGALVRHGERRHARYHVAIPLRPVALILLDESGEPSGIT